MRLGFEARPISRESRFFPICPNLDGFSASDWCNRSRFEGLTRARVKISNNVAKLKIIACK